MWAVDEVPYSNGFWLDFYDQDGVLIDYVNVDLPSGLSGYSGYPGTRGYTGRTGPTGPYFYDAALVNLGGGDYRLDLAMVIPPGGVVNAGYIHVPSGARGSTGSRGPSGYSGYPGPIPAGWGTMLVEVKIDGVDTPVYIIGKVAS